MTADDLRRKASDEATAKITLKRELNVSVTPAEVRECYTNHEANFEEPEKVHVEHILLLTIDPSTKMPLSTNMVAEKRKQIDDLLKRAKAGEDFSARWRSSTRKTRNRKRSTAANCRSSGGATWCRNSRRRPLR